MGWKQRYWVAALSSRRVLRRRAAAGLAILVGLGSGGLALVDGLPAGAVAPGFNGQIAFVSERDGNPEIYSVNPDGSGLVRLTNNASSDAGPEWSPDGSRIAFSSDRAGNQHVFIMNADGSAVTNVTSTVGGGTGPSWSPDGRRIAYGSSSGEVVVLNLTTGTATQLTSDACLRFPAPGVVNEDCEFSRVANHAPSWSPDGHLIAFLKNQGTSSSVWLMNADGSNQRILNGNASHANYIDWSPNGQRLAYSDHSQSVQVVNRDGGNEYVVPNTRQCAGSGNCFVLQFPAWSPDGSKLVAATAINDIVAPGLYTFAPDGSGLTRILADDAIDAARPSWQARRVPLLPTNATAAVCERLASMQLSALLRPFVEPLALSMGCSLPSTTATTSTSTSSTTSVVPPSGDSGPSFARTGDESGASSPEVRPPSPTTSQVRPTIPLLEAPKNTPTTTGSTPRLIAPTTTVP